MKRILVFVLILALLTQCASTYRPVDPISVEYNVNESNDDIDFSYRYDVLSYRGNRKYPKREKKHGFNILSAKITNKTNRTLNFVRDLELYTARGSVFATENEFTAKTIRQPVLIYLLYILLGNSYETCDGKGCRTVIVPVGLFVSGLNIIVAGTANAKMKAEFNAYSPHSKDIAPGETVYAIIAVRDIGFAPLKLRVRDRSANRGN